MSPSSRRSSSRCCPGRSSASSPTSSSSGRCARPHRWPRWWPRSGLMLTLQALVVIRFKSTPRSVDAILPNETLRIGGVDLPRDRLYLTAITIVVGVVLWAYFRYARLGLATQAPPRTSGRRRSPASHRRAWHGRRGCSSSVFVGVPPDPGRAGRSASTPRQPDARSSCRRWPCALDRPAQLDVGHARRRPRARRAAVRAHVPVHTKSWWPAWGEAGTDRRRPVHRHDRHAVRARPLDPDSR